MKNTSLKMLTFLNAQFCALKVLYTVCEKDFVKETKVFE